ncbi:MAG TPA: glycosyltransferase family 4 protein [Malonomonas sp.]
MARFAGRLGLVDVPGARSSHVAPTPRGGGIGILAAFIFAAWTLGIPWGLWLPATAIALVSFFDDRLDLSPKVRLLFQFFAAFLVFFALRHNALAFLPLVLLAPFIAVYIVGTTNFFNFMDGINGIAGVTGLVAFSFVAWFSAAVTAPTYLSGSALGIAMACLGFLPLNLPKAKVFMGDVGSILLGFCFAAFVVSLAGSFADILCLNFFMFPFYADALYTLFIRWRDGERLSQAHRRHLYQVLSNELGFPHWQVTLGYGVCQLLCGGLMILAWQYGLLWQLGLWLAGGALFILFSRRIRRLVVSKNCANVRQT